MHITKLNSFISLQISKFTSLNPIYQNSNHCSQYLSYTKMHKHLKLIYPNSYMYVTEVNFFISLYISKFTSINLIYQNPYQ